MKKHIFGIWGYVISALFIAYLHFQQSLYWCHQTNEVALTFPLTFAFSFIIFTIICCTGIVVQKLKKIPDAYLDRKRKKRFVLVFICSIILSGVITFLYYQFFYISLQQPNSGLALSFAISLSWQIYTFLVCTCIVIYHIHKK